MSFKFLLPIHHVQVARYIVYLVSLNYSYNTIKSHISVINFVHRIRKMRPPGEEFIIRKILIGVKNTVPLPTRLLPIDRYLLLNIIVSSHIIPDEYERILFNTICTWLYHGCFRVGELLFSKSDKHIIKTKNIAWKMSNNNEILGIRIILESFKFSQESRSILLEPASDNRICPISCFCTYLKHQKSFGDFVFRYKKSKYVQTDWFYSKLKNSIQYLNENPTRISSHSFRIGYTTDLANAGYSIMQIKDRGRWSSFAFLKYIRPKITKMKIE